MKYSTAIAVAAASVANAGFCDDAFNEFGNFFCPNPVKQIKYSGLDIPGKYRAVASMDKSGACTYKDKPYSGPIAPFDEDLMAIFRGPCNLAEFAVFTPVATGKKRDVAKPYTKRDVPHHKRHGHQHLHHKKHPVEAEVEVEAEEKETEVEAEVEDGENEAEAELELEKRAEMVTAVINGVVQTWENNYFGPAATATAKASAATYAAGTTAATSAKSSKTTAAAAASASADTSFDDVGDFKRAAYYNAAEQVADGLVFLGNVGDDAVSGTFDTVWGASLALANEDGTKAAASPTVLKDAVLPDNTEIIIASDVECGADDCGTIRPGSVAYKGWSGPTKVFIAKFKMPLTGKTGFNQDMPAWWLLNGGITRTAQYGGCSCWKGDNSSPIEGGCGEVDVFEVLRAGDTKAKSTFHFAAGTGDSHYFDRPVDKYINVALVFQASSSTASIKVLSDDFAFPTSLTSDQVEDMVADEKEFSLLSLMTFGAL